MNFKNCNSHSSSSLLLKNRFFSSLIQEFDPIAVRNELVKKYNPSKYQGPYTSDKLESRRALGDKNGKNLLNFFLELPLEAAIRLWESSDSLAEIRREASRFKSIERVYLGPLEDPKLEVEKYFFTRLMLENIKNAFATRNRKRIIKQELINFINVKRQQGNKSLNALSIGAGSARAVIEAASYIKNNCFKTNLKLVDHDSEALLAAGSLAKKLGIESELETITAKFFEFSKYLKEGVKVDFVEIVGLLDYLNDRSINFLLSYLYQFMNENGLIIFSNVSPNDEQEFLHNIVGWPKMRYRTKREIQKFADNTGFRGIELIKEPTGFVNLVRAKKY